MEVDSRSITKEDMIPGKLFVKKEGVRASSGLYVFLERETQVEVANPRSQIMYTDWKFLTPKGTVQTYSWLAVRYTFIRADN